MSLAEKRPDVANEWHPTKNGSITPRDVFCKSEKSFYWQCSQFKDHIWKAIVYNRTGSKNSGCPFCRASKGEKAIKKILEDLSVNYITQFKFENCKNKSALPFDFAIFPYKKKMGLIEFQGEQHFKEVLYWGGKNKFNEIKKLDQIKIDYCREESIPLLILLYSDTSLQNKIQEFIKNHL